MPVTSIDRSHSSSETSTAILSANKSNASGWLSEISFPRTSSLIKKIAALGITIFVNTRDAAAQAPAIGEFLISTNTTDRQTLTSIIGLKNGSFVVGWDSDETGDTNVYTQLYDKFGYPVRGPTRFNDNTTYSQLNLALDALPNGGYIGAWVGNQEWPANNIYYRICDGLGLPQGPESRVNTITKGNNPDVAVLNDGGWVVVWGTFLGNITGRIYDNTGAGASEFPIATTSSTSFPRVIALTNGDWVVVWKNVSNLYGRLFNSSNATMGPELLLKSNATEFGYAVTALPNGSWAAAWAPGTTGVYCQIYDSEVALGPEIRVNNVSSTASYAGFPAIKAMTDGSFVVTWEDDRIPTNGVYGRRFDASGNPLSPEFPLSLRNITSSDYQSGSQLARLEDGTWLAGWLRNEGTISGDIWGQRFYLNGSRVTTNLTFPVPAPSPAPFPAPVAAPALLPLPSPAPISAPIPAPAAYTSTSSQVSFTSTLSTLSDSAASASEDDSVISLSIISYQVPYNIYINGVAVGTFTFSGGAGSIDGSLQNTLNIDLDSSYAGEPILLFTIPDSVPEGTLGSLTISGPSCQNFQGEIISQGISRAYQITLAGTTCSSATKLSATLRP